MSTIRWDPFREFERNSGQADKVHPRPTARRSGVADANANASSDRPPPPDVREIDTIVRLTVIAPAVLWRDWHW